MGDLLVYYSTAAGNTSSLRAKFENAQRANTEPPARPPQHKIMQPVLPMPRQQPIQSELEEKLTISSQKDDEVYQDIENKNDYNAPKQEQELYDDVKQNQEIYDDVTQNLCKRQNEPQNQEIYEEISAQTQDIYDDVVAQQGNQENESVYEELHDDVQQPPMQKQQASPPGENFRAVAIYDYQASDTDEISFDPGEIITGIVEVDKP